MLTRKVSILRRTTALYISGYSCTVPLCESKLFISTSRSCPILVLTTVMGQPRHAKAMLRRQEFACDDKDIEYATAVLGSSFTHDLRRPELWQDIDNDIHNGVYSFIIMGPAECRT